MYNLKLHKKHKKVHILDLHTFMKKLSKTKPGDYILLHPTAAMWTYLDIFAQIKTNLNQCISTF